MSTVAVDISQVHKSFGRRNQVHAVQGIDLTISTGEIVALLGPNGAGKTTTIDMILGLSDPDRGTVQVMGGSPWQAVAQGKVSALMQTGGLLRDLTVLETVTAIAALHGAVDQIPAVLRRTNLANIQKRKVSKCSGGEQQRIKFALALLPNPDLIILDEPTAGMDVGARREFWQAMQEDAQSGRTIIFATHYLEEAQAFAQRTVLMNGGKIVADGTTAHIRAIASGRVVTATLPATEQQQVDAIKQIDGVKQVSLSGDHLEVTTTNSDELARLLLTRFGASDLEISGPSLETAFVHLTAKATS